MVTDPITVGPVTLVSLVSITAKPKMPGGRSPGILGLAVMLTRLTSVTGPTVIGSVTMVVVHFSAHQIIESDPAFFSRVQIHGRDFVQIVTENQCTTSPIGDIVDKSRDWPISGQLGLQVRRA